MIVFVYMLFVTKKCYVMSNNELKKLLVTFFRNTSYFSYIKMKYINKKELQDLCKKKRIFEFEKNFKYLCFYSIMYFFIIIIQLKIIEILNIQHSELLKIKGNFKSKFFSQSQSIKYKVNCHLSDSKLYYYFSF